MENFMTLSLLFNYLAHDNSCVDCQSRYFDCEFDQNENDTRQDHSDGGLGAGNFNYVAVYVCHYVNTLESTC
jgi:hypothetical protein